MSTIFISGLVELQLKLAEIESQELERIKLLIIALYLKV